jgi:diaminohydroxyphosphoribosylaminopyrimidine deaminase/5-amino-6-(5-phosphoribosylamino)uracil reductase
MLRAAGIDVVENVMGPEATALNVGFLKRVVRGLPFVTLKLATTLDGRIATATGESRWITGPQARRAVHAMRLHHDAVMVGSGTALADDPDLTVRDMGAQHQPLRILMDSHLRHAANSRLGQSAQQNPVLIVHTAAAPMQQRVAWQDTGATLLECPSIGDHIDLTAAFQALAQRGLTRILCEGGGNLAAALIRAKLVDQMTTFNAGALIGSEGQPALGPLGLHALGDAPRLRLLSHARLGLDTMTEWAFD